MNSIQNPVPQLQSVKDRVVALLQAVFLDGDRLEGLVKGSNFQSGFKPVILGLVKQLPKMIGPMLDSISDEDLKAGIRQVRDEFIPFLLDEKKEAKEAEVIHANQKINP